MIQTRTLQVALTLLVVCLPIAANEPTRQESGAPKGKIAVINTDAFPEQIGEFKAKLTELNRRFEPQFRELQGMADKITALEQQIQTQGAQLGAARVADMTQQAERLRRDYQRRREDLETDGGRERDIALRPINEKLMQFAQEYTAKRGIVLLIDLGNAFETGTLIWFDERLDVTQDFINEYNRANP